MRVALLATGLAIVAALVRPVVIMLVLLASGHLVRRDVAPGTSRLATGAALLRLWIPSGVRGFLAALEKGARGALGVATACALAGVIVGVVTKTGAGLKLASGIISVSGNNLLLTMFSQQPRPSQPHRRRP